MAICFRKEIDQHTTLAIWEIKESVEELCAQIQLKESEENFLQSLLHEKRKLHWLSARVLLRVLLDTAEYIECHVDDHGKPFLVDSPYSISISHSFDYAAVMISDQSEVGIDIERMSPKIVELAPKFLSTQELLFIDQTCQVEHLYACWCAKEAIYKLHGKRGVSLLNDIHLKPFTYQDKGKMEAELVLTNSICSLTVSFEKFEGYMVSYSLDKMN